jgi:hypothetical protein
MPKGLRSTLHRRNGQLGLSLLSFYHILRLLTEVVLVVQDYISWGGDDDRPVKRTLGVRDRQILYRRAKGRCENPHCKHPEIDYDMMEVGHTKAYSKGGTISLKTARCLCPTCNKLQGTDSWAVFLQKQKPLDKTKPKPKRTKRKNKEDDGYPGGQPIINIPVIKIPRLKFP